MISFASSVRRELALLEPEEDHCRRAELAGFRMISGGGIPAKEILSKSCCKRNFLRGVFLAAGSIGDPEKIYHLEMILPGKEEADLVIRLMKSFGISARTLTRKNHEAVYMKDGDGIVDFLALIKATTALLELENVRVVKDVRNSVNRQVNCETANLNKTVSASLRQVRDIEFIRDRIGFDKLPEPLREIAVLRLRYPDDTLQELGERMDPPVGKSGVNHRLRRLREIAGEEEL